ncbi:MAG: TIGR02757 family protein, partial [Ignavibacteria bacterium]|nr:TIGR02757 family protein [Ignavibacteria bacterium]
LKQSLDDVYHRYNVRNKVIDPIQIPQKFTFAGDIEIIGFISALSAFGRISQIMVVLDKVYSILAESPFEIIKEGRFFEKEFQKIGIYHRFLSVQDYFEFFTILHRVIGNYGSLENMFRSAFNETRDIRSGIALVNEKLIGFSGKSYQDLSTGMKFLFAAPNSKSANKRMMLFLRWMVRKDANDFSIWNCLQPADLIIPLDTHIAKVAADLRFSKRRIVDWKTATEITNSLRRFDPLDPVKYDFALCHWDIDLRTEN